MKYQAFISYSRATDEKLAQALQKGLRRIGLPWWKKSELQIFRDQTNLSASPDLWGHIEAALDESHYFILLASPQSAASKWVRLEIEHFLKNRSSDNLLIALTEGSVVWDEASHDFDWNKTTALPPTLRSRLGKQPNYVDLRSAKAEDGLSLRNALFLDKVAELAADTLYDKPKDELVGDDVRQQRRTRRTLQSAVAVLSILLFLVVMFAYRATQQQRLAETNASEARRQQGLAEDNAREARKQQGIAQAQTQEANVQRDTAEQRRIEAERQRNLALSRQLAAQSEQVLGRQHDLAVARALAAYEATPTTEARRALLRAVSWNPQAARLLQANGARSLAFSRDGRFLAVSRENGIDVWDVATWHKTSLCHELVRDELTTLAVSADGRLVAAATQRLILLWDVSRDSDPDNCGSGSTFPYQGKAATSLAFSPDGQSLAVGFARVTGARSRAQVEVMALNRAEGQTPVPRLPAVVLAAPAGGMLEPVSVAFSPDNGSIRAALRSRDSLGAENDGIYEWKVGSPSSMPVLVRPATNAVVLNADGSAVTPESAGAPDRAAVFEFQSFSGAKLTFRSDSSLRSLAASSNGALLGGVDPCGLVVILQASGASLPNLAKNSRALNTPGSPDTFLSVTADGARVVFWDLRSGLRGSFAPDPGWQFSDARFLQKRREVAVVQSRLDRQGAPRIQVRSLNGALNWEMPPQDEMLPFAVSDDGRLLAHGSSTVSIWDIQTKRRVATLKPHREATALVFTTDGARLLVATSEILGRGAVDAVPIASLSLETWGELSSRQPKRLAEKEVSSSDNPVDAFSILRNSPDGGTLAAATPQRLVLMGASEGELNTGVGDFAFSSDARIVAVLNAGRIVLWDVPTGEPLAEVPVLTTSPATRVAFTADDRYLIYANAEGIETTGGPASWQDRARQLLGDMKPRETCGPGN